LVCLAHTQGDQSAHTQESEGGTGENGAGLPRTPTARSLEQAFSEAPLFVCREPERDSRMRRNRTAIILFLVARLSHAQDAAPSEREFIQQLVGQVNELQRKV